jgi:hypothetical protein
MERNVTREPFIFITGASRSGTTLLSFVLRNHSAVFGLRELQYFGQAWDPADARRRFTTAESIEAAADMLACQERGVVARITRPEHRLKAAAFVAALGSAAAEPAKLFAAVTHHLAASAGKSIACEQTPRNIFYARELLEVYPSARVVHIVRDPRAVMASQKKRWRQRRILAQTSRPPGYESLRVWVNYHPYTIARLWSRATAAALALEGHPRVTLVRFEDLVRDPEGTVRHLCERLGIGYEPGMLDVGQVNSSHQVAVGGARRGLNSDAIDRWQVVLSAAETAITERMCAPWLRRFGYAPLASRRVAWPARAWYRLSYVAHLVGVMLVNPGRAYVQGRAVMGSRSVAHGSRPAGSGMKV